ncbi:MAG TPA: hypothetical protein VIR60_03570, partial [Gammaproteobacteria bacterium]
GEFLPVAGVVINEPVRAAQVDRDRLFVLSESGLYAFALAQDQLPRLAQQYFTALADRDGVFVDGDRLLAWNSAGTQRYLLADDGALSLLGELETGGSVRTALADGELVWLQVDGEFADNTWLAYRDVELVGLYANGVDALIFDGAAVIERVEQGGAQSLRRRAIQAQAQTDTFAPVLSEQPLGVLIGGLGSGAVLGGERIEFRTVANALLAAIPRWIDGETHWFIPRSDLQTGGVQVIREDRSGAVASVMLTRNESALTVPEALSPASGASLTRNAWVPVRMSVDATSRIAAQDFALDGAVHAASLARAGTAHGWIALPDQPTATVDWRIDGVSVSSAAWTLIANNFDLDSVTLRQPANNQAFTEGQDLVIDYTASQNTGEPLRFTEIALLDFNRQLLERRVIATAGGRASLRLPSVSEQTNLFVRVRGYFGDSYRYAEREVGIRVFPQLTVPNVDLTGVNHQAMAGSTLHLAIAGDLPAGVTGQIRVEDAGGALLGAGQTGLDFLVPASGRFTVIATVADGFGNTRSVRREVAVIDPFRLTDAGTHGYELIVPGVGDAWFVDGRRLYNAAGQLLATLESTVTALVPLGDRLVAAVDGIGLQIVDPADGFRILSTHALAGRVARLATTQNRLVALVDGRAIGFAVAGNALEERPALTLSGQAVDVRAAGDHFVLLSDQQVARFDAEFHRVAQINGSFSAMTQQGGNLFVSSAAGVLHLIRPDFTELRTDIRVAADRLLALQGDLLALSRADRSVSIIDVRDPQMPRVVGRYPVALAGAVDSSVIVGGRLWLTGDQARSYNLARQAVTAVPLHESERPRGFVADVALDEGRYLAAAQNYGALTLQQDMAGAWVQSVHPAPYLEVTNQVAAANGVRYLLQPQRVLQLDGAARSSVVLQGQPFSHLALTDDYIVASSGADLHLATRTTPRQTAVLPANAAVPGDQVVALTAQGGSVYVAMASGALLEVRPGALPLVQADIVRTQLLAAAEPIRTLASDGDHLYYALGNALHRLSLYNLNDVSVTLAAPIDALACSEGRVWAGVQNQVVALNAATLAPIPGQTLTADAQVTGIDAHYHQLILGQGSNGVQIYQLPARWVAASAALATPAANTVFRQGESIMLGLADTSGVNAVHYRIAGQTVAITAQAPFAVAVPVPAELRNGQPFEITTEIETVWGETLSSQPRRVILQGEGLPVNPFQVALSTDALFLPNPLEIRAEVIGSTQPVQQVEFYYSADRDGPYELFGRHYGPDYRVLRNFTLTEAGHFLKARAVDVYGNTVESAPVAIQRFTDPFRPTASIALEGQLIGGSPAAGHPFNVNVTLNDNGSGVQLALLKRNGLLVA